MKGKKHNGEHHGERAEHRKEHHRARGGKVEEGRDAPAEEKEPKEVYEGKGSDVEKEAAERKHGGKVRKRKHGGKVEGEHARHRLDRPGRKRGGRVGAEHAPLSAASRISERPHGKTDREDD